MSDPSPSFMDGRRFYIHTFGCQMNENDSERLAGVLIREGAIPASDPENADLLLVNTCAVREKTVEKVFSLLGRWKRLKIKNQALLGVMGCVAQLEREKIFTRQPAVDFVIGPHNYFRLAEILKSSQPRSRLFTGWSRDWHEITDLHPSHPAAGYVTVMEGCNNFCSYCIVPFTRGREKSRPVDSILNEVRSLVARGYNEIQLLGQNVNSYHDPRSGKNFAGLLKCVDQIDGLKWLRFITSHPRDFTLELADAMAASRRVCRQIHLPIQAGSDLVLERMNRGYTRSDYLDKIEMLRSRMPEISLSTDIIVGFPGEKEADFRRTLDVLEQVRYTNIFSFRYSPRPLTRALAFQNDVTPEEKRERLIRVQELQRGIQLGAHHGLIGRTFDVLCTGRSKKNPGVFSGRNQAAQVINFFSPDNPGNDFVRVRITDYGPYSLLGVRI